MLRWAVASLAFNLIDGLSSSKWVVQPRGSESSPSPRSGATATTDGSGRVLLFGGYEEASDGRRRVVNDLWAFKDNVWTLLDAGGPTGVCPGPRLCSASFVDGGELVVCGGWDPQESGTGGVILDDVWMWDISGSSGWKKCSDPMPQGPTSRHAACAVGSTAVVHTFRSHDNVLVWEPSTKTFREQFASGEVPSSRGLHVAAPVVTSSGAPGVAIFGGADKTGSMCNDAFVLDTASWVWSRSASDSKVLPSPRAGAAGASTSDGRFLVVVGGATRKTSGGLEPLMDVWALDIASNSWSELLDTSSDRSAIPAARNAATLTTYGDHFLLHAGWNPFVESYSDSFVLELY